MMSEPVKLIIEVVAGIIPGEPIPELTRSWSLTAEEVRDEEKYREIEGKAMVYTLELHVPSRVNWVRQEWLWT